MENEYLKAAAQAIDRQASASPGLGIPVDPDVADYMGAFEEDAVSPRDLGEFDDLESGGNSDD